MPCSSPARPFQTYIRKASKAYHDLLADLAETEELFGHKFEKLIGQKDKELAEMGKKLAKAETEWEAARSERDEAVHRTGGGE